MSRPSGIYIKWDIAVVLWEIYISQSMTVMSHSMQQHISYVKCSCIGQYNATNTQLNLMIILISL